MAYIVATLIRKAIELKTETGSVPTGGGAHDELWKAAMLSPFDYKEDETAVFNELARDIMGRISFKHGGAEYDAKYPDGIPTSIQITDAGGGAHDSGLVMYPAGHARNETADLEDILQHKFKMHGQIALNKPTAAINQLSDLQGKSPEEIQNIYMFDIHVRGGFG